MNQYTIPGVKFSRPMQEVADIFCERTSISLEDLREKTRRHEVVKIRFALIYFLRIYSTSGWRIIGEFMGGYDHKSMCYAFGVVKSDMGNYEEYRMWIESLNPFSETIKTTKVANY